MTEEVCQCGFGEEYFTIEGDQSICTVCGGHVTAPSGKTAAAGTSRKFLIVDDQPFFRKRIREALVEEGNEVLEAGEGIEAVRIFSLSLVEVAQARGRRIAAVILDLTMPGLLDGFQTLGVLKAMDDSLPVIILTSSPPTDDLLKKLGQLRAKKYLNKASKGLEGLLLKNLSSL